MPALISFLSAKITGALQIPLSVESCINPSVLRRAFIIRRAFRPPSGSPSSVGRPALHRTLRLLLFVPRSVGLSVFRRSFRPPSSSHFGVLPPVERFALRQALCLPLGVPPSVGISVLCRSLCPRSGSPPSVGRSAVRRVLHFGDQSPVERLALLR